MCNFRMTLLNKILECELKSKKNWFQNFISQKSTIEPTSNFRSSSKVIAEKIILKPDYYSQIFVLILFSFVVLFSIFLLIKKEIEPIAIFFTLLVFYALFRYTKQFYFDDKYTKQIMLSAEGIKIDNEIYYWNEISDTAIMKIGYSRGFQKYLILILKNGQNKKFNIDNFNPLDITKFENKLAKLIENQKIRNCR